MGRHLGPVACWLLIGLLGLAAILTPATPSAAFALGQTFDDPVQMYLNDVFTVTVNLAGLPGVAVPTGLTGSSPLIYHRRHYVGVGDVVSER